jgi:hypothetical protein
VVARCGGDVLVNVCRPCTALKLLSRGGWFGKLDHEFAYVRALEKSAKRLRNDVKPFTDIFMRFQSTSG